MISRLKKDLLAKVIYIIMVIIPIVFFFVFFSDNNFISKYWFDKHLKTNLEESILDDSYVFI